MLAQEIIRIKRDGGRLSPESIRQFVKGLTEGTVSKSQASAFAMAIFFRGMSRDELVALTLAMRDSGHVINWRDMNLPGPVVDKHSTGGVGDNVSLMLAPMLAACGCYVPMISGRGLGHTGGTLDKFDSIPGYVTQPDDALFRRVVKSTGCAIIGQTSDLAPADKKLYAIRDVTATVESIPLITASILSKKLAAGLDALVLDVKAGSGAFMADEKHARELAQRLTDVADGAGLKSVALITDMDEPLASAAGNAVEMLNAIEYLNGKHRDARLHEVTLALGAELLVISGMAKDSSTARVSLEKALNSGAATERFAKMVTELGGPSDFMDRAEAHLPKAKVIKPAPALTSGMVTAIKTREIGMAVVELGGGRRVLSDKIDHSVGFTQLLGIGARAEKGQPLALVHARDEAQATRAIKSLQACYEFGDKARARDPVLARIVSSNRSPLAGEQAQASVASLSRGGLDATPHPNPPPQGGRGKI
jgi:thymidine phosphorylase